MGVLLFTKGIVGQNTANGRMGDGVVIISSKEFVGR